MKFLTETVENVQVDIQESAGGVKDYYITGIFMQSGIKNKNGRIYPPEVLAREMNRYSQEQIKTKRSVGELNHPDGPNINLDKVSHMITELWVEGQNIYGKAKILNTPQGQIVKTLIDEGVQLGVSTRGFGSVKDERGVKMVQPDFRLATIDIVQDPSCQSAYVSTLMESKEFFVDDAGNIRERDPNVLVEDSKEELITEEDITEQLKPATFEDPLVTVEDKTGLVSHNLLSVNNNIYKTQVSHTDVHKAPVETKSGHDNRKLIFKLSKHDPSFKGLDEDVVLEQFEKALNEISKKTLGSYIKKSSRDLAVTSQLQGSELERSRTADNEYTRKWADDNAKDFSKIRARRQKGIERASKKLSDE